MLLAKRLHHNAIKLFLHGPTATLLRLLHSHLLMPARDRDCFLPPQFLLPLQLPSLILKEDASVVDSANVFLLHPSVLWPQKDIRSQKLKNTGSPTNRIRNIPLPLHIVNDFAWRDGLFVASSILLKDLLKVLGHEAAFVVICIRVRAVLVFVDAFDVNGKAEVGNEVGEPGAARWEGGVGEVGVDDEDGEEAHEERVAEGAEAAECVVRPDDAWWSVRKGVREIER